MNKAQRNTHLILWILIPLGLITTMWFAMDGILAGQRQESAAVVVNELDAQVFLDSEDFLIRGNREAAWIEVVVKKPLKNASAPVYLTIFEKQVVAMDIQAAGIYRIPWDIGEPTAIQVYDSIKQKEILALKLPWE